MDSNDNNKSYIKSILTLLNGSIIAQIFTLICAPILTRICTPEDLGTYSLVTGATTIFGMIMSLRYEICIVSEPDEHKIFSLINLSFRIDCFISLLVFVIYYIYFQSRSFANNTLLLALITASLAFMLGVINIITAYNNRCRAYKLITKTYILRTFCQNIGNLLAGFLGFGVLGLSTSQLIGYFAGVNSQIKPLINYKNDIVNVSKNEIRETAIENKKQPLMSAPAVFANGLSYSLINYFIEALYTTTLVGYYSISYRILGLPLSLVSQNVSRVFMERASLEKRETGNFKKVYKSTLLLLLAMAVPMVIVLMLFSPYLCEFFFGEGWNAAGEYIRILAPMMSLRFIAGGMNCSAIVAGKQQYDLLIQILLTINVIIVFILSNIFSFTIEKFLFFLSIIFSCIYILYILLFWVCAKG